MMILGSIDIIMGEIDVKMIILTTQVQATNSFFLDWIPHLSSYLPHDKEKRREKTKKILTSSSFISLTAL